MKNISIPKGMRGFILPLSFLGKLRLCTWQILFLLFFISLQAQAQQSDLLTLNMKNVTLKQFVEAVQTQSGYSFLYKDNQLKTNQRITVSVNKQSINVALEQAFKGKEFLGKFRANRFFCFRQKRNSLSIQKSHVPSKVMSPLLPVSRFRGRA